MNVKCSVLRSGTGMLLLPFLLLFVPVSLSQAQTGFREGFVIKANGDTLTGWVYYSLDKHFRAKCRFKRFEIAPVVTYGPLEITGFGFKNGRYFEALSRKGETRFYECMSKGLESRFLLPGKSDRHVVLLTDTASLVNVREYNRTAAAGIWDDCSITRTSPLWSVGVTAGYQFIRIRIPSSLQTQYFGEARYDKSFRPVAGVSVSRSLSRKDTRFFLDFSLLYFADNYYGYASYKTQADCRDELFIQFSGLQVPLAFRYSPGGRHIRPFFTGGVYGTIRLHSQYYRFSERQFGHEIFTDRFHDFSLRNDYGYFGSMGAEFIAGQVRRITCGITFLKGSQSMVFTGNMYSENLSTHLKSNGFAIMLNVNL